MERELDRMRRHSDSSGLLLISPDAPVDVKAMDLLGARFANSLRSYDALCRYGANRFLILLPHVVESHVSGIVRRLRIQVTGYSLQLANGTEQYVTSVIGAAMLDPAASLEENIERVVKAHRAAISNDGNAEILRTPPLLSACGTAAV
jgi:GGDEF domain-containing protein